MSNEQQPRGTKAKEGNDEQKPMNEIQYADAEMEYFKRLDGLSEGTLRFIRLELITAFRVGYERGRSER